MNNQRSFQECKNVLVQSIQNWLDRDMCQKCAMMATAAQFEMSYGTVERIWVGYNVDLLDGETALD